GQMIQHMQQQHQCPPHLMNRCGRCGIADAGQARLIDGRVQVRARNARTFHQQPQVQDEDVQELRAGSEWRMCHSCCLTRDGHGWINYIHYATSSKESIQCHKRDID
ncbi:hypothetical protein PENTCL1PPCAC_3087, partial [Pristionchus entomophagus]